jgi:hypothetical protein
MCVCKARLIRLRPTCRHHTAQKSNQNRLPARGRTNLRHVFDGLMALRQHPASCLLVDLTPNQSSRSPSLIRLVTTADRSTPRPITTTLTSSTLTTLCDLNHIPKRVSIFNIGCILPSNAHLIFYTGVASGLIVDPLSPSTNATAVLWWKIVPEDAVAPPLIGILGYSHVEPPAIVGIW